MVTIEILGSDARIDGDYPTDIVVDATSYFKQGYQFMQRYRYGRWDGRIRMFSKFKRTFPAGLVEDVVKALREEDVRVQVSDQRLNPPIMPINGTPIMNGVSFEYPYEFQLECMVEMVKKQRGVIAVATNGGKCLGEGTPVLKYDGSVVPVEQIKEGDMLIGPDSSPRWVTSTIQDIGPLYLIEPLQGEPWVCNDAHILTLVHTETNNVVDIPLNEYLKETPYFRHCHKQFMTGVSFREQEPLPIDPYFLGVWFGDGGKDIIRNCLRVSKPDLEIYETLQEIAVEYKAEVKTDNSKSCPTHRIVTPKGKSNPLLTLLREVVLDDKGNVRVPPQYLTSSKEDRAKFLAGFIDTDGYAHANSVDIVQKRKNFIDAVWFIARSLGLRALRSEKMVPGYGIYYRVSITGDFSEIPIKIERKLPEIRKRKTDPCRTGFKVTSLGEGKYYGFTLDGGDSRFLLGDFTVTHNTEIACLVTLCLRLPTLFMVPGKDLLQQTRKRFATRLGLPVDDIGMIGDGVWNPGEWITIATTASLHRNMEKAKCLKLLKSIDLIFADECFVAGTSVDGRPIEEIRKGELVWSFDEDRKCFVKKPVTKTYITKPKYLVKVLVNGKEIICTLGHPFYTQRGWVPAVALRKTDSVLHFISAQEIGHEWFGVDSIEILEPDSDGKFGELCPDGLVYNLEVEGTHTYLAENTVVHNCHRVGSDSWYSVLRACPAFYRFGLSGTPLNRTDGADMRLTAATGPTIYQVRNKDLIERGISNKVEIQMLRVDKPYIDARTPYKDVYEVGVVDNLWRNKELCSLAAEWVEKGRQVVILVSEIEHGEKLSNEIQARKVSQQFIHGKKPTWVREQAILDFESGDLKVLISSTILDEGVDTPCIDVLILAGGLKSYIKALQRIGRGVRKGGVSDKLIVIDTADFQHEYLLKHSLERLDAYKAEDCFEIVEIKNE